VTSGIAIYGGTFDPVHIGHLRSALDAQALLDITELRMVPSFIPPHREQPGANALARLEMLSLAIRDLPGIVIDRREIDRSGVSYSIDTLKEIRREQLREDIDLPLFFVMGQDAFALIHTWREWQSLTDFAHLVILERPRTEAPQPTDPVLEWLIGKEIKDVEEFGSRNCGQVLRVKLTQLDVSATDIRRRCHFGQAINLLVPTTVQDYIAAHKLYQ
jgi:nicotinate-nucleotide adenylyltransferase